METLLKNLKEQVTCSICLDIFTDPKTITCLHTFCCECIKKHALISQRNGKFRCPECQAEVGLPEANLFDKLPTSFHHNRLLSLLAVRQSGDGNEISCGICKKKSAEISYCFECAKFMCSDCVNAHQLFTNLTEGHKVTPVKQFQAQDYEALVKRQSFCSQQYHEREIVRFFCLKCKLCVCQICIATDHKTHDVELLDKVADGEKGKILAKAAMLKGKIQICDNAIRKLEQIESELETNIASAKREVSHAVEQIIAKIREREREIITNLENTRVLRAEMLNSTKMQVHSLQKQVNQAIEFAENLVQRSSSLDFIQSKANFEQRFEHLGLMRVPEPPVNSFAKFCASTEPLNLNVGFVATSEPVIKKLPPALGQDFQAGVESELEVHLGIHEEQASEVNRKLRVEVLVEPAQQVGSLLITCEKENGALLVKFTPKIPGIFEISVKVNDKLLTTSPYTVEVKQRLIHVLGELDIKGESFEAPRGIARNSKGLIAVADSKKHCILLIDKKGCVRKQGTQGKDVGQLNGPTDVSYLNDDNILVAEELNHRVQQFNIQTGNSVKSFGKQGSRDGEFTYLSSVFVDDEGRVIVADGFNNRIQVLSQDGEPLFTFGDSGGEKIYNPAACVHHENKFIVSDWGNNCLKVYDDTGKFLYKIGEPGEGDGKLKGPDGLCLQRCGNHHNLLVCNRLNGRVDQFTLEGCFTGKTVDRFQHPTAIATTPNGFIFVSDTKAKKIYILK